MVQMMLIERPRPDVDHPDRQATMEPPEHPNRVPARVHKSTLEIYLEWMAEIDTILRRHGEESVESWQTLPAVPDLADELRAIGDAMQEIGAELHEMSDSLRHAEYDARSIARASTEGSQ